MYSIIWTRSVLIQAYLLQIQPFIVHVFIIAGLNGICFTFQNLLPDIQNLILKRTRQRARQNSETLSPQHQHGFNAEKVLSKEETRCEIQGDTRVMT